MDEISFVHVKYDSYIYTHIYVYLYDIHCRLLPLFTTCVPKESVQSARIKPSWKQKRRANNARSSREMGANRLLLPPGQTALRGKARPINHFTIPSDHLEFFSSRATPTARPTLARPSVFSADPSAWKQALPRSALAAYWFIFAPRCPTTYSIHARTHTHIYG